MNSDHSEIDELLEIFSSLSKPNRELIIKAACYLANLEADQGILDKTKPSNKILQFRLPKV